MEGQIPDSEKQTIKAILDFWFPWEGWNRHTPRQENARSLWFSSTPERDQELTEKFKGDLDAAGRGEREHWKADRDGRLAYIILCDQYARNIYRKKPEAFAFDHLSLAASKEIIASEELFSQYKNYEKFFIIMPHMHSESVQDGEECCRQIQILIDTNREAGEIDVSEGFKKNLGAGQSHLDIVKRFGRYPTRNRALGRENTAEEEEYLKNSEGWGQ